MGGLLGGPLKLLGGGGGGGAGTPLPPSLPTPMQISLGRDASSGEADRMSPNLSPLRSDDKIPLKSSDVSTVYKLSVDTTLSVEYCLQFSFKYVFPSDWTRKSVLYKNHRDCRMPCWKK